MDLIMTGISASERQRRENLVAATRNLIVEKMQLGGPSMRMIEVKKHLWVAASFLVFIISCPSSELSIHSDWCAVAGRTEEAELNGNSSARSKSEAVACTGTVSSDYLCRLHSLKCCGILVAAPRCSWHSDD